MSDSWPTVISAVTARISPFLFSIPVLNEIELKRRRVDRASGALRNNE